MRKSIFSFQHFLLLFATVIWVSNVNASNFVNLADSPFLQNNSLSCPVAQQCYHDICSCMGFLDYANSQPSSSAFSCLQSAANVSCLHRRFCLGQFLKCVNTGAGAVSSIPSCLTWASAVAAVSNPGNNEGYASQCVQVLSQLFNSSSGVPLPGMADPSLDLNPGNCAYSQAELQRACACGSPSVLSTTYTLGGNWDFLPFSTSSSSSWFGTSAPYEATYLALEKDFSGRVSGEICISQLHVHSLGNQLQVHLNLPTHYQLGALIPCENCKSLKEAKVLSPNTTQAPAPKKSTCAVNVSEVRNGLPVDASLVVGNHSVACPNSLLFAGSNSIYSQSAVATCDPANACFSKMCAQCLDVTTSNESATCLSLSSVPCVRKRVCLTRAYECLNEVGEFLANATQQPSVACQTWSLQLYMALLGSIASTDLFNQSEIYKSCEVAVCEVLSQNATTANNVILSSSSSLSTCQMSSKKTCRCLQGEGFETVATLSGNWHSLMSGGSARSHHFHELFLAELQSSLESDLQLFFQNSSTSAYINLTRGIPVVCIRKIETSGTNLKIKFFFNQDDLSSVIAALSKSSIIWTEHFLPLTTCTFVKFGGNGLVRLVDLSPFPVTLIPPVFGPGSNPTSQYSSSASISLIKMRWGNMPFMAFSFVLLILL